MSRDSKELIRRQRREQRYSREQNALQRIILHCRKEVPTHDLQKQALERIHHQLQLKIADEEHHLGDLEKRQQDLGSDTDGVESSFSDARANAESRLAAVRSDERTLRKQLASFENDRIHHSPFADETEQYHQSSASRFNANLHLFLQKSPTKRPLLLYSLFPPDMPSRPVGTRDRKSAPELKRIKKNTFIHSRAHSSTENMGNHFSRSQPATTRGSKEIKPSVRDGSESGVPAVDEFTNSFSFRVITPSQAHRRRSDSLRRLRLSANKPMQQAFKYLSVPDRAEFGSATIIPQEHARHRSEFASTLESIELPSYVKNLIQGFESKPSISLDFSNYHLSAVEKFSPISSKEKEALPLSTSPLIISPIIPERSSSSPTKLITPKFSRKQRSIFTLHIPRRPEPGFASRSTLVGSPTATVSDCTIEVPAPSRALPEVPKKSKGLPSTRLYDLSQLDRAPDDVLMTPNATEAVFMPPLTPRRSKLAAPMHALRDVKSRLFQFHRR